MDSPKTHLALSLRMPSLESVKNAYDMGIRCPTPEQGIVRLPLEPNAGIRKNFQRSLGVVVTKV